VRFYVISTTTNLFPPPPLPHLTPRYQAESQNVQPKGQCTSNPTKNNPAACPEVQGTRAPGWSVGQVRLQPLSITTVNP